MGEKKKILIADDDRDFVRMLCEKFEHEGFETLVAYEGVRVIESAHKSKPDLILLDIQMPAGEGWSVLERLRAHPETTRIPIIIVTGGVKKQDVTRDIQGFFRKPFEIEELLNHVKKLTSM